MNSANNVTTLRLGKWELRIQLSRPVPANVTLSTVSDGVVTGLRAQGAKGWLKPSDGIRWKNAMASVQDQLGNTTLTFVS